MGIGFVEGGDGGEGEDEEEEEVEERGSHRWRSVILNCSNERLVE